MPDLPDKRGLDNENHAFKELLNQLIEQQKTKRSRQPVENQNPYLNIIQKAKSPESFKISEAGDPVNPFETGPSLEHRRDLPVVTNLGCEPVAKKSRTDDYFAHRINAVSRNSSNTSILTENGLVCKFFEN